MFPTVITFICWLVFVQAQFDPNFAPGRHTIVHLFEWTWDDVAVECDRFLGPYGYGGVQVSPVNENRVFIEGTTVRPWFERYQPVSYNLNSTRSGNETQFREMVHRCNTVGVRIYVDAVINHMCGGGGTHGVGTGGSSFNYVNLDYPGVPYSVYDFNGPYNCYTFSGNIEDYQDIQQVRNCRLSSTTDQLSDLNPGSDYVKDKIVSFLNRLLSFGVAGFRFDATKHMWPDHIAAIIDSLDDLSTTYFDAGLRPFVYQEVIDLGGEAVSAYDYLDIARVTEFNWGIELGRTLKKQGDRKLSYFVRTFLPSEKALVFVDNHDNQRGHGANSDSIITFKDPRLYKIAQAFTLANVYGVTRVMSSYHWDLDWAGPPHDSSFNTLPVIVNTDLTCGNGWVCEHRWRQIYNMVQFRNVAYGQDLRLWWDNDSNQIAFSRGNVSFIAINNDDFDMNANITTSLEPGIYCDLISGNLVNGTCTGSTITVNCAQQIEVDISKDAEDPMVATHYKVRVHTLDTLGESCAETYIHNSSEGED